VARLLEVSNLRTWFESQGGAIRAVDGVDFTLEVGRTLGIVGESGSGKSVTALSIMRLVEPPGRIQEGSSVVFDGRELTSLPERQLESIRGADISMVFQEPMTSLNPVYAVGEQIAESVRIHQGLKGRAARARALEMLELVGIPAPEERAKEYPHQLSGGMRQRVVIAMALVMRPALVIADEPTTALDVTIQAQILELLTDLQQRFGTSILLITHDMGVVAETASRVIVMYGGEIVEQAPVSRIFANPHHPYTEGLLGAMPRVGQERERLRTIPGTVPPPTNWPTGCRFHDRCPYAWDRTAQEHPPLYEVEKEHFSRCHLAEEPQRRLQPHEPLVAQT
jgi:peptide/nickel transport system ATP-binding protein